MASSCDRHPTLPPAGTKWNEEDELRLLEAVLEIAQERPQDFDPSVSLFLRIGMRLGGAFNEEQVLKKVKDLRRTHESGGLDDHAEDTASPSSRRIRDLCAKIWGEPVIEIPPPPPSLPLPPPGPPQV